MGYYFWYYDVTTIFWEITDSFGWIVVMPWILYGIERRSGHKGRSRMRGEWQSLPFLAWAALATWRNIEFFGWLALPHGPPMELFFRVSCVSFFALGALCTSHTLICTFAGEPSWSLGGGLRGRVARTAVLVAIADALFMAAVCWGHLPHGGWAGPAGLPLFIG